MIDKQKAIEKAYGEHWESVKDYVDENGWIKDTNRDRFSNLEFHKTKDLMRPLSLQGIETNNGWIKIESEADLPKDETEIEFWIFDDGEILHAQFMIDSKRWFDVFDLNLEHFPTHYQPIIKPKPPIY